MGKIEDRIAKNVRRTRINEAVIAVLALTGFITAALIAPKVANLLGRMVLARQNKQRINIAVNRLIKAGYIIREGEGFQARLKLTEKGQGFAALLGEGKFAPKRPKRWDGKWRILIFDIPERYRKSRVQLRTTLSGLGFNRLQDSVWVYPYDCEDLMLLLKTTLRVGRNMIYIVADAIEYDKRLREIFELGEFKVGK